MPLTVETVSNYDISALSDEWSQLEARSNASFFLSWAWISCWLQTTNARPTLVRTKKDGKTIALGFLGQHRTRRHLRSVRQLYLNETGEPEHDRLTIEHNGFLTAADAPADVVPQIFRALIANIGAEHWDELVLSGVRRELVEAARAAGLMIEIDRQNPDYCVDLQQVRKTAKSWLSGVSANLRAQIRQSRTFAERDGPIALIRARTVQEGLAQFDELRRLHGAYWRSKGKAGAFSDHFSVSFHRSLIASQIENGSVQILRLSAGERTLGYLYNFFYRGTVSNYQSGFAYLADNRYRPGLLAHALAIEQALATEVRTYDFLAGDSSYKQRLGEDAGTLIWCRAQRRAPGLIVERLARRVKRSLLGGGQLTRK